MSRWFRLRRHLDRVVAFVGGLVFLPVIALLAVFVRLADRGPGFVAVPRVGVGGATFAMHKLRSMRPERADGRADGPALTSAGDDRITPLGAKLRAVHLDELPQLLNVVRAEMALLGARPEAPDFVDPADPLWRDVLVAPPGIAGPTQLLVGDWERERISSAPDGEVYRAEVLPVKLAIDRWYLRNATPALDVLVGWALLHRLSGRPVPARLRERVRREVPEAAAAIDFVPAD